MKDNQTLTTPSSLCVSPVKSSEDLSPLSDKGKQPFDPYIVEAVSQFKKMSPNDNLKFAKINEIFNTLLANDPNIQKSLPKKYVQHETVLQAQYLRQHWQNHLTPEICKHKMTAEDLTYLENQINTNPKKISYAKLQTTFSQERPGKHVYSQEHIKKETLRINRDKKKRKLGAISVTGRPLSSSRNMLLDKPVFRDNTPNFFVPPTAYKFAPPQPLGTHKPVDLGIDPELIFQDSTEFEDILALK